MLIAGIRRSYLLFSALCLLATGCVDGPFGGLPAINPYLQHQWAKDEQFGPTFHRRLADFRGLRESAARLDLMKKELLANDLNRVLVTETNPVLRAEITGVLGELAIPATIEGLQAAVADTDKDVRIAACRAWSKLGPTQAIPVLTQMMDRESDVDVRLAIITELGRFQDQTVTAALGRALDDGDPAIQFLAVQSLKSSTGRDYGDSVPAWRDFVQGREPQPSRAPSLVQRMTSWF
jgi:HEAT repeat protein